MEAIEITWGPWVEDGGSLTSEGSVDIGSRTVVVNVSKSGNDKVVVACYYLGSTDPVPEQVVGRLETEGRCHADGGT